MPIRLGVTFWGGFTGSDSKKHLWFVVSDPELGNGSVLIVNMTTKRDGLEDVCVLTAADHSGVDHESVINYLKARIVSAGKILEGHRRRPDCIIFAEAAELELVRRILQGALRSQFISPECQSRARAQLEAMG